MFGEERRAAPRVFCDVFSTVRHGCFPTRKNAEEVEFGRRNGSELCSGQFSFPSTHNVPWIADGSSTSSRAEHSATMRSAEFRHTFASALSQSTSFPVFMANKKCPVASRLNAEGAESQKQNKDTKKSESSKPRDGPVSEPNRFWPNFSLATRGRQHSISGAGSAAASVSSPGGLDRVFSAPVGPRNRNQGLQASVCWKTPSFQRGYSICGKRGFGSGAGGRDILPHGEGSYKTSSSGGNSDGFLLTLLSNPKERWESAPNTGPACFKQALKEVQIQDAHSRSSHSFDPPGRLVRLDRSQGCLLSYKHLSSTQEISQVFLSERSVRICYSSIRAQSSSAGVQQMHGSSAVSAETQGSAHIRLSGRLPDMRPHTRARGAGCRDSFVSSHKAGIQNQQRQKPADSVPGDRVSGPAPRLGNLPRHAFGEKDYGVRSMPDPFSQRKPGLVQNLSPSDGHDGFISVCDPTGFIKDERFSALDFREAPVPAQAPRAQGTGIHGVCDGSPPLENPLHIPIRGSAGERVSEKSRHYGRIPNGMGSRISGQIGERSLDTPTARASHKHAGADGSFSGFKTFSTILEGFSCFSQDGQHNGGGVHQPPRGNAIVAAAQSSAQADCLERRSLELTARDARPGSQKCGGGSSVEGQPDVRRMGSPPAGGESNLGDVRQGCRRSLRLAGKRKMSAVFLSRGRGCAVGCGCAGAPVAKRAAVCIPTVKSNFSHPGQSKRKRVVSPSNSPPLAGQAVVGRDRRTSARRALAAPAATGPAVTSGGTDISPSPRTNQPLGLAREGLNLNALGLPREVISTIQSARAPSTRSLYDLKWRVFEDWCTSEGLIPFQCSVRDILCFLQSLLDNGRAFSTIKVYLAAISACHVGFEGVSVGRHPLICRFMKGVKRVRPAVKRLVPSWDLSLVLDALTRAPFEPLEDIPIKLISLKTALLLALVSAKRVSELHALSVHQACMDFSRDDDRVKLLPNPAFVPKVSDSAYNCSAIELHAFHSPPHLSAEESKLHTLCPVRALRLYVNRTRSFRRSDQLFVSWATRRKGEAVSSQRLSHWIVEAIELAYTSRGLRSPEGLRAHSSRGIATSWALFRGISVRDICKAASWSSPHTFIRFYRLDVTAPSLAHAVLNVYPL
ncbi:uncharacterized protein LOC130242162 [Danio aesculapii]|uniref:uncharacterized protein LOC130242162 n=1 Tax=Danio aesculapii TaxID=1142201 RepID=UPI0024C0E0F6|nr:uncharacterized protein LOC130242162 [Danio aesculapii]